MHTRNTGSFPTQIAFNCPTYTPVLHYQDEGTTTNNNNNDKLICTRNIRFSHLQPLQLFYLHNNTTKIKDILLCTTVKNTHRVQY
jgi:hypothetical protein